MQCETVGLCFAVIGRRYVDMNRSLATSSPSSIELTGPFWIFVCFAPVVLAVAGGVVRRGQVLLIGNKRYAFLLFSFSY